MNAFATHFAFEFKTGIRNKQLLLLNYLFPLGFFLMMGFIMTEINPLFEEVLIPAMVIFAVIAATFLGMPDPLVNAREKGIFRSYRINGVPSLSILVIPMLTTMLHTTIVSGIIVAAGHWLFQAPLPIHWGAFALAYLALLIACCGLCVLIGVIAPNSRMTILWSQLVFTPSMLLGGLMLPFEMLPAAAQKIALLLPATHAMNAFKVLAMLNKPYVETSAPWFSIGALALTGLLGLLLAIVLFSWDSKNAVRRTSTLVAVVILLPFAAGVATSAFSLPETPAWPQPVQMIEIIKTITPALDSVEWRPGY